jgi:iron complex transport system substrate-binding protein
MRIVSLLPSATEIVCALGLEDELVGVSHECDWPPSIMGRPVVTRDIGDTRDTRDARAGVSARAAGGRSSRQIHDRVTAAIQAGAAIHALDAETLRALEPDLVLTQGLCRVCAVGHDEVEEVMRDRGADVSVVSLEPTSIEGIFHTITTVGAMAEVEDAAIDLVEALRERLGAVERRVAERREAGHRPPRVVALEWLDPPFSVGHWVPEQIRRAGGWDLLGADGGPAGETTWDALVDVDPELLFLMPCGFHLAETVARWAETPKPVWFADLPASRRGAVVAVDGSAYFSRPGPRVIDGIELLAEVMDPAGFVDIAPPGSWTPVPVA